MWLIDLLLSPWRSFKQRRAYKRRLAALRKRDPFIYR